MESTRNDFAGSVAALLRCGSCEQYEEVQNFVFEAVRGDRIDGDMMMEIIWELLPKMAQKKIAARRRYARADR